MGAQGNTNFVRISIMLEGILFGIIQGVTEWLPISSDGAITFVKINFFGGTDISDILLFALYLHLGTFFAALIYLRKEVKILFKTLFNFKNSSLENQSVFKFILISTLISGALGYVLFKAIEYSENFIKLSSASLNLLVGFFLLITAVLQLKKRKMALRNFSDINISDSIVLGIAQGISVLPGLSRSGLTVSTLLLRKFNDEESLKLSFLMSLPIVFLGNIVLNLKDFYFSPEILWGILFSFIFGILTIHYLLKLAKKINFGYFALILGILMIFSVITG